MTKVEEAELVIRIKILLEDMPKDQPPRGHQPKWGEPSLGTKARAFYMARRLGADVQENCASCGADVMDRLRDFIKHR